MPTIQQILADIDATELTEFSRAVPVRTDFLLQQAVLPTRVINNVKYRTQNRSITVAAASYRAWDTPTPRLRVQSDRSIKEGNLLPLGGKESIEELATILAEVARGADGQSVIDAAYDNVANQTLAIYSRLEVAAGDVLTDGILTIEENGVLLNADFGVPVGNKPTAAVFWDDPAATPLDDERAWIDAQVNAGRGRPARVITSNKVASLFAANAQYRNTFWGGETASIDRPTLTPDQVNSVRATYGLPPITTYDVQVPIAQGDGTIVVERVIPENRYIMLPADTAGGLGETLMGLTAEALVLDPTSNPRITGQYAGGLISTAKYEDDPVSVTTKTTATGLPVLHTPEGLITAQVLA